MPAPSGYARCSSVVRSSVLPPHDSGGGGGGLVGTSPIRDVRGASFAPTAQPAICMPWQSATGPRAHHPAPTARPGAAPGPFTGPMVRWRLAPGHPTQPAEAPQAVRECVRSSAGRRGTRLDTLPVACRSGLCAGVCARQHARSVPAGRVARVWRTARERANERTGQRAACRAPPARPCAHVPARQRWPYRHCTKSWRPACRWVVLYLFFFFSLEGALLSAGWVKAAAFSCAKHTLRWLVPR